MKKYLIIRFSSIGDIVLTTPVIRSLKQAEPDASIHYLTKQGFASLLISNPYVDKVHGFKDDIGEVVNTLRQEQFDFVLDLHHNLRSLRIKSALRRPAKSFHKANVSKFLMTKPALRSFAQPISHIVERYAATLHPLGMQLDDKGLDFFLPPKAESQAKTLLADFGGESGFLAIVLGATYQTKRWLPEYFVQLIQILNMPVLLLGGKDAREEADLILQQIDVPVFDAVGNYDLLTAAALMKQARAVLAHDTGFMHIAAAFKMKVFSLWGNTVPEFGMTPFRTEAYLLENKDLSCRPCSKIGYDVCPKGHFKCMKELLPERVAQTIQAHI